jgi:hypothetical protein
MVQGTGPHAVPADTIACFVACKERSTSLGMTPRFPPRRDTQAFEGCERPPVLPLPDLYQEWCDPMSHKVTMCALPCKAASMPTMPGCRNRCGHGVSVRLLP